ncbi:MAG: hypothetical protein FWD59_01315 [Micrococcales bacterium]|nr:hypothetical protein [Micrococcales bacterium]
MPPPVLPVAPPLTPWIAAITRAEPTPKPSMVRIAIDPAWDADVGFFRALAGALTGIGAVVLVASLAVAIIMVAIARYADTPPRQRWSTGVWLSLLTAAILGSVSAAAGWGIGLVNGVNGFWFTP